MEKLSLLSECEDDQTGAHRHWVLSNEHLNHHLWSNLAKEHTYWPKSTNLIRLLLPTIDDCYAECSVNRVPCTHLCTMV